jgi:hypothetical protein
VVVVGGGVVGGGVVGGSEFAHLAPARRWRPRGHRYQRHMLYVGMTHRRRAVVNGEW